MDERSVNLDEVVAWQGLLGYLNFSEGRPDPRFQKQLNDAFRALLERGTTEPWRALGELLPLKLAALKGAGAAAFADARQVAAVLRLTFDEVLPAYRKHHRNLLQHRQDHELWQPFLLARVFEAVLAQAGPWSETERVVQGALQQLNDFVGYRPIAVLETQPRGEPYPHERVRPIPLYLRGVGVSVGSYEALLNKTLELLRAADPGVLDDACLDLDLLDELAIDPRAYDHGHPVNRRANYVFGEWDPHHLDQQSRYRRYVMRQEVLDAATDRLAHPGDVPPEEAFLEAAAVVAGTILMATGVSGSRPSTHDSVTSLSTLIPRIARYRDAFYEKLLTQISPAHAARLRAEAERTRQPFGGARQHLNHFLARQRASQLQQKHLALIFATMGYPTASRDEATRMPAPSVRILSEILIRLTTGQRLIDLGNLHDAATILPEVEQFVQDGIACGAVVDPWNLLGFQGQFPLFHAAEDTIHDPRVDELVRVMELTFHLYARLLSESAAAGDDELRAVIAPRLHKLAEWWDQFASVEVSNLTRVHGGEAAQSADHVAAALARWHERGAAAADLAFWRQHLKGFSTPKAFALVIDALLRKQDYRASMALLMNWLSQVDDVPLEDGLFSFHALALRWMLGVIGASGSENVPNSWPLVRKFYDHLEANADSYWQVPELRSQQTSDEQELEDEDDTFAAAYEGVTYKDTTDDGTEGSLAEEGPGNEKFDLEAEGEELAHRLKFLSTLGQLWQITARQGRRFDQYPDGAEALKSWFATARRNHSRLLALLDALHEYGVPEASGSYDSLVEYDRRRGVREQILEAAISTSLDQAMACRALRGAHDEAEEIVAREAAPLAEWEPLALFLEKAIGGGDARRVRRILPDFVRVFQKEPLLYVPLDHGGHPRKILRTRLSQATLRGLLEGLPRLGLLRETYHLLQVARRMEQVEPPPGRKITEFDRLFQTALQAVVESVVESAAHWEQRSDADQLLVKVLETLLRPFLGLWVEHSQSLRLAALEGYGSGDEWKLLRRFISQYGKDLFNARFLTLANLRGILHRGTKPYLEYLRENPDPMHPIRLLDELDDEASIERAATHLQIILQAVVEGYEEYKDYNSTTAQSDYGDNLHVLLDFLRLKASYDRHAWHFRPIVQTHEILARRHRAGAAILWQEAFTRLSREAADQHGERLNKLESEHGVKLRTIRDRIEERFVKTLSVDRLCALVEPAMEEALQGEAGQSFARLQKELEPFIAQPVGVGLDVPPWLRRVEVEVQRVRASRTTIAGMAEEFFRLPRLKLSLEELKKQLQDWDQPLLGP